MHVLNYVDATYYTLVMFRADVSAYRCPKYVHSHAAHGPSMLQEVVLTGWQTVHLRADAVGAAYPSYQGR